MSVPFYYYTLLPDEKRCPKTKEHAVEIDLNLSSDFGILFQFQEPIDDLRAVQLKRWDFLKKHPEELNIIANILKKLYEIAGYTTYDLEKMKLYSEIVQGKYGNMPISFFTKNQNNLIIDKILHYLILKNQSEQKCDYFKPILMDIFQDKVTFYYDKIKKVLYVSFIAAYTKERSEIFGICKYFFADILFHMEVRWKSYPAILDKTNYVIACEDEQLCGTIL